MNSVYITAMADDGRTLKPGSTPFWETIPLDRMTAEQWESLCDGCGRCCLVRFEDEETGTVIPTHVACKLFDADTCRCTNYPRRKRYVPDCIKLTPGNIEELTWMPPSCGYRRVFEGRGLASWHPLVSGDPESVHNAGVSVRGRVISETALTDLEDAIDFPAYELLDDPPED